MLIRTSESRAFTVLVSVALVWFGLAFAGLAWSKPRAQRPVAEFAALLDEELQSWTPTWYPEGRGPETDEQRRERRSMVASVIHEASQTSGLPWWPSDTVALLSTIWKYESGSLDYHVHGGEPSPIGHGDHRAARCLGQIHYVANWWTRAEWEALEGRDREATTRCAAATLRILGYHAKRCRMRRDFDEVTRWRAPLEPQEAAALFAAYADGHSCSSNGRTGRVAEWARIRRLFW